MISKGLYCKGLYISVVSILPISGTPCGNFDLNKEPTFFQHWIIGVFNNFYSNNISHAWWISEQPEWRQFYSHLCEEWCNMRLVALLYNIHGHCVVTSILLLFPSNTDCPIQPGKIMQYEYETLPMYLQTCVNKDQWHSKISPRLNKPINWCKNMLFWKESPFWNNVEYFKNWFL